MVRQTQQNCCSNQSPISPLERLSPGPAAACSPLRVVWTDGVQVQVFVRWKCDRFSPEPSVVMADNPLVQSDGALPGNHFGEASLHICAPCAVSDSRRSFEPRRARDNQRSRLSNLPHLLKGGERRVLFLKPRCIQHPAWRFSSRNAADKTFSAHERI
jgi:hypothetical protein